MSLNLTFKEKFIIIPFVLVGIGGLFYAPAVDLASFFSENYKNIQKYFKGEPNIIVELENGRRFSASKSGFGDTKSFTFINPPSDINIPLPPKLIRESYSGSYVGDSLTRLLSYYNDTGVKLESNDTTYNNFRFLSYQDTLDILINKYKEKVREN